MFSKTVTSSSILYEEIEFSKKAKEKSEKDKEKIEKKMKELI